jgi:hypothetical protein
MLQIQAKKKKKKLIADVIIHNTTFGTIFLPATPDVIEKYEEEMQPKIIDSVESLATVFQAMLLIEELK